MASPAIPKPSISVVIPTRNRTRDLCDAVRTVAAQTVLPCQLVIVDQSDADQGLDMLLSLFASVQRQSEYGPELTYIHDNTLSGLTAARNVGVAAARGDIVLFLDDDVLLQPDFIAELLDAYEAHPEAVGVSGVITNYSPPDLLFRIWSNAFMLGPLHDDRQPVYWEASVRPSRQPVRVTRFGGGLMSFRTCELRGARFDENLHGVSDGEDVDFCIRLGANAPLFIAPSARLVHNHSPAGRDTSHWLRRHARGNVYLYTRHWNRGFRMRAGVLWLNLGYALMATVASCRQMSLSPWRDFLVGKREGATAARCSPSETNAFTAQRIGGAEFKARLR